MQTHTGFTKSRSSLGSPGSSDDVFQLGRGQGFGGGDTKPQVPVVLAVCTGTGPSAPMSLLSPGAISEADGEAGEPAPPPPFLPAWRLPASLTSSQEVGGRKSHRGNTSLGTMRPAWGKRTTESRAQRGGLCKGDAWGAAPPQRMLPGPREHLVHHQEEQVLSKAPLPKCPQTDAKTHLWELWVHSALGPCSQGLDRRGAAHLDYKVFARILRRGHRSICINRARKNMALYRGMEMPEDGKGAETTSRSSWSPFPRWLLHRLGTGGERSFKPSAWHTYNCLCLAKSSQPHPAKPPPPISGGCQHSPSSTRGKLRHEAARECG